VLLITRSIKNTFAPINRVPPDVLSLIPGYRKRDKELIKLTHVCRSWREIFISRASLWTFLACNEPDKTSVYIQRSRKSPLKVRIGAENFERLPLVASHVDRLKALELYFYGRDVSRLIKNLSSTAPLLEKLALHVYDTNISKSDSTLIESTLFDGNLSSLRELCLSRIRTSLPWQNMSNLTSFELSWAHSEVSTTQLLDFFERAPLLRQIKLLYAVPHSSNTPAGRVMSLHHLKSLRIYDQVAHSILLNHLRIPTGASVMLEFEPNANSLSLPDYLPRSSDNLCNVSHITFINLDFDLGPAMRLHGPSGDLRLVGRSDWFVPILDSLALRDLHKFPISTTESLTISRYAIPAESNTEEAAVYQTLLTMNNLRTITLINCINLPFILALNPNHNASNAIPCPKLQELVLYIQRRDGLFVGGLLEMARARASMGVRLSTIAINCSWEPVSKEKAPDLKNYVANLDYRLGRFTPRWDAVPGDPDEADDDSGSDDGDTDDSDSNEDGCDSD